MPSAQTGTLLQNYYSRNTINLHIWCGALSSAVNIVSFFYSFLHITFVNSAVVLHTSRRYITFIPSAPPVNLWEQTAVYCSGGGRVKISNRLIPRRDNTTNITVIHQKKCLMSRVFAPLSIFHQTFQVQEKKKKESNAPIWAGGVQLSEWMVLILIRAVTCCWKTEFLKHVIDFVEVFSRGHIDWDCKR